MSFIEESQRVWFGRIKSFLLRKNLNVGSGLGYFSKYAADAGIQITSLEVALHPGTINTPDVILYDGHRIPFADRSFDASVATYVLHHADDKRELLKEMKRVSAKRIIIVEEIYYGLLGKLRLMILDSWTNFHLKQKSSIRARNYFAFGSFREELERDGWGITLYEAQRKWGFDEVLCVIERA